MSEKGPQRHDYLKEDEDENEKKEKCSFFLSYPSFLTSQLLIFNGWMEWSGIERLISYMLGCFSVLCMHISILDLYKTIITIISFLQFETRRSY